MFYPVEKSLTCSLQSVPKSMGASLSVTKDIHAEVLVSTIRPKLSPEMPGWTWDFHPGWSNTRHYRYGGLLGTLMTLPHQRSKIKIQRTGGDKYKCFFYWEIHGIHCICPAGQCVFILLIIVIWHALSQLPLIEKASTSKGSHKG